MLTWINNMHKNHLQWTFSGRKTLKVYIKYKSFIGQQLKWHFPMQTKWNKVKIEKKIDLNIEVVSQSAVGTQNDRIENYLQSILCNFCNLCSIAVRLESNRHERYVGWWKRECSLRCLFHSFTFPPSIMCESSIVIGCGYLRSCLLNEWNNWFDFRFSHLNVIFLLIYF